MATYQITDKKYFDDITSFEKLNPTVCHLATCIPNGNTVCHLATCIPVGNTVCHLATCVPNGNTVTVSTNPDELIFKNKDICLNFVKSFLTNLKDKPENTDCAVKCELDKFYPVMTFMFYCCKIVLEFENKKKPSDENKMSKLTITGKTMSAVYKKDTINTLKFYSYERLLYESDF